MDTNNTNTNANEQMQAKVQTVLTEIFADWSGLTGNQLHQEVCERLKIEYGSEEWGFMCAFLDDVLEKEYRRTPPTPHSGGQPVWRKR